MSTDITAVLTAALAIARKGIPVFPCATSKVPTTPHGFKDAASDPRQIRKLWEQYPGELIGVPTGRISGIDVLDIDAKPEGKAWWADNRRRFPRTRIHRTRSGGLHLLFKHDDVVRCSASKIARGVDTRGDGGYIIWWPAAGLPIVSDAPLAPWPAWISKIIKPPLGVENIEIAMPATKINGIGRREEAWATAALDGLASDLAGTKPGTRNSALNAAAYRLGHLIARGWIDRSKVENTLFKSCVANGLVHDDGARAVRVTIRSGLGAGITKPHPDLPERPVAP